MTDQEQRELLTIAKIASQKAADIIKKAERNRIQFKGAVDLVTETDLASEQEICTFLHSETPHIPILAEEGGGAQGDTRWIIDPLDGTTNFAHGFPHYAVSIGLEWQGLLRIGVIYAPCMDELFAGALGMGAHCNGITMSVSSIEKISHALLGTGFPYDRRNNPEKYTKWVTHFLQKSQGIRRAGSAALDLAYIAAGRLDGFWEFGLQPWDMAAGKLLIHEAGGRTSGLDGSIHTWSSPCILAGNPMIQKQLVHEFNNPAH